MKIVLDVKNEMDLTVLLPLLERLKIPFTLPNNASGKAATKVNTDTKEKNFDAKKLEALFNDLQQMRAFAQIEDPSDWQRRIRDEWN